MTIYKRIFIFILAIFLCGLGIAVSTQADLGTTPISSLPYVLTFMTPFTFGTTTFLLNMIFITAQKVILGNDFKKTDYLQIIITLFFGIFIDLGMHLAAPFKSQNYIEQLIMLVTGSAILALGVTCQIAADLLYIPGEGLVKAISYKTGKNFGRLKIGFDITHCITALILSVIILHAIRGLREGTVIAAFLVGGFVCLYSKLWKKYKRICAD